MTLGSQGKSLGQRLDGVWCMPSTMGTAGLCSGLLQQGDSSAWFALEAWKEVREYLICLGAFG